MGSTKAKRVLSIVVYSLLISSVFIVAGCKKKKTSDVTGMIPKIRIVYHANGATNTATAQVPTDSNRYAVNAEVTIKTIPAFAKSGSNIDRNNWNTQADGNGTAVSDTSTLTLNAILFEAAVATNNTLTLYAKWN